MATPPLYSLNEVSSQTERGNIFNVVSYFNFVLIPGSVQFTAVGNRFTLFGAPRSAISDDDCIIDVVLWQIVLIVRE